MNKMLLVIRREIVYNIKRPAFIYAMIFPPIIMIGALLLGAFTSSGGNNGANFTQIGFVDNSTEEVLSQEIPIQAEEDSLTIEAFIRFDTREEAAQALEDDTIGAFFILPTNYMLSGQVGLYSKASVPSHVKREISDFMVVNLSEGIEFDIPLDYVLNPANEVQFNALDTGRSTTAEGAFFMLMFPVFFSFILILSSLTTSSFLMSGLVEEKTNRIIEILITTVTPMQLLSGKVIGLGVLGVLQMMVFIGVSVIGLVVGNTLDLSFLQGVAIPAEMLVLGVVYYLLGYLLLATVLAGIGAMSDTEQESRQISVFITLPVMAPYFAFFLFITDPNGTVPVLLSLFPITSPLSMLMRLGITAVPFWQIALSITILVVSVIALMWVSARLFRFGLLRYGKKFSIRDIIRALVSRPGKGMQTTATQTQEVAQI